MDNTTKQRHAYKRGFVGDGQYSTDYTLYLAGDEVCLHWQWEADEDNGGAGEIDMSVTDLKRLIQAGQKLLKASGNDTPLPVERPASEDIY
ncbi:hypothetical protein KSF_095600 [Reticulibacter mediterranei]|uniref:Uncharacterized protein n=1 Tax=Reticulibacter mediterranei TaxID=2778369 RepID=A0A8J3N9N3_9CHLR|nr:hypothetical protein [Reticulibacter mediterranei]GHO99512.1 hypothetical protein KSF_095600 [Reticulibacter mediterranei]